MSGVYGNMIYASFMDEVIQLDEGMLKLEI